MVVPQAHQLKEKIDLIAGRGAVCHGSLILLEREGFVSSLVTKTTFVACSRCVESRRRTPWREGRCPC